MKTLCMLVLIRRVVKMSGKTEILIPNSCLFQCRRYLCIYFGRPRLYIVETAVALTGGKGVYILLCKHRRISAVRLVVQGSFALEQEFFWFDIFEAVSYFQQVFLCQRVLMYCLQRIFRQEKFAVLHHLPLITCGSEVHAQVLLHILVRRLIIYFRSHAVCSQQRLGYSVGSPMIRTANVAALIHVIRVCR